MKKTSFMLSIMVVCLKLFSQDAPIKWKEVPLEDLKMTEYVNDTSASAIILCDYGQRYFGVNPNGRNLFLFNDRHVRIKILKPEGLKYAHLRFPYQDMDCQCLYRENSIIIIKGMTYNLDEKGEIIATRLKQKSIKKIDSVKCIKIAEFELPNVKPGSIIEYEIKIPTLDLVSPESWYFQNDIPTLYSEFRMKIPTQFSYLISPQNVPDFDISEEKFFNQSLMYSHPYYNRYRRISSPFNLSGRQVRFVKTSVDKFEYQNFTDNPKDFYQSIKIHLVRATRENMDYLREPLTHALAATTIEDYDLYQPIQRKLISYPTAYVYYSLPDWNIFNQKLLKSDRFGLALIKHWNYEQMLEEIIKEKETPEQKMIAIYDFIRKNVKWTGEYTLFVDPVFNNTLSKLYTRITKKQGNEKSLRKSLEKGSGTSSEINFILIYLLNKAGIDAYPVIISTRDHGKIDTVIPDPRQFNHVLALAKINDKQYFLDATDSLRPYNILDVKDITSQGFLVKNFGYGWINIENTQPSALSVVEQIDIDKDLNYSSKTRVTESGYYALDHRKEIASKGKESFIKHASEKYDGLFLTQQIEAKSYDANTLPLIYELSKSGKATNSNEISFKPNFDPVYNADDFNDLIRLYSISFPYAFTRTYAMEISIPDGFSVKLPENKSFSTYGGNAAYQYQFKHEGNKVILSINVEMKINEFPAQEYSNLKQLFTELNDKIKENIIIKKLEVRDLIN